jgi:hypothetical protein
MWSDEGGTRSYGNGTSTEGGGYMMESCRTCGRTDSPLRQGWTNALYCSSECERAHVSAVHASMPGGKLPRPYWVPHHVGIEIKRRWADTEGEGE